MKNLAAGMKITERLLAALGGALLVISSAELTEGWMFQSHPQLFLSALPDATAQKNVLHNQDGVPSPAARRGTFPGALQVLGRFEIPRLHVSTLVLEGDGERSLRLGIGHVPGTSLPGMLGNAVLAGHRDTFFRCLRNIQMGDELVFRKGGVTRRYWVSSTEIVTPEDVSVLKTSAGSQLTLITCFPFGFLGAAPKRFVVIANSVPENDAIGRDGDQRRMP